MNPTPHVYAARLALAVRQTLDTERDRLQAEHGAEAAVRWLEVMDTALSSLSIFPERCAVAREDVLLPARVRQLLVPPRRPRWRLLFTVHEGDDEAPTVRVHLLRPIARAPLTRWPPDEDEP